jgi:hypothetical protein
MANSRDFELAQTPKPCELCEAGTSIKFKHAWSMGTMSCFVCESVIQSGHTNLLQVLQNKQ